MPAPDYGEVWLADLGVVGTTVGREQAGRRPALVVSPAAFNAGPLVICVPLTRADRGSPLHVRLDPPEGGLRVTSYAMCDQIRALSRRRLEHRWGQVTRQTMSEVIGRLRRLTPAP